MNHNILIKLLKKILILIFMDKCYVCGKLGNCVVVCDNSCGTKFCSIKCSDQDTHDCGEYCSECEHMMILLNNNWFCNYCKKNQTPKLLDDEI